MKIKKFWNKKSNNEIFIYGDIVSENFFDSDVTAKNFADDLNSFVGPVTVHINSNGGDCFTALAISNLIKNFKPKVTISIDGICASAATLISCAGHHVTMAENALMMIHLPSVFLADFFDKNQLVNMTMSLMKVENSILQTYAARTGLEISQLGKMVEAETWLSAQEAKDLNFIDEITGAIETEVDNANQLLILNSVALKKNYFAKAKEKLHMDKKNLLDKLKDILTGEDLVSDANAEIENKVRAAEIERIKNLNSLRCGNEFVDALIDTAISEGRSFDDVKTFVDALKNIKPENKILDKIAALIEDNLKSGAEGVGGSEDETKKAAENKIQADMIADFANKILS